MQIEEKLLQDIINSNKSLSERLKAFAKEFSQLTEKDINEFLDVVLFQTLQTKEQINKCACFIEFLIAANKKYLIDPEFTKVFLKYLFEMMKSNCIKLKTKAFKKLRDTLYQLMNHDENNSKKMVLVGIQKLDIDSLEVLMHMLEQSSATSEEITQMVRKRIQKIMGSLEKKPISFRSIFFSFCDKEFIKTQIISSLKKLLMNKNFSVVQNFFSRLGQMEIAKIESKEELLVNTLYDSLVQDEKVQQQCFEIMKSVLSSDKEYESKDKVSSFIDGVTKKLYKKESPFMSYHYCNTICQMHISGLINHQKVFEQYFQSNLFMSPQQQNEVQSKFLSNQSFLQSENLVKFLIESQKINNSKGNYYYSILDALRESKQENLKELLEQQLTLIMNKAQQNKEKPITIANYQNFIYANAFHLETLNEQDLSNHILMKNNFLFNKNMFNLLSHKEAYYLVVLLMKVDEKLSQQKDISDVCLLLLKLVQLLGPHKNKVLDLSPFLIKTLMKGICIYNVYVDQNEEEKLASNIIVFLASQKNLEEVLTVKGNMLMFLKIISFSNIDQPFKKYFIQHKLLKRKIEFLSDLQFKEIQFILREDNIQNTDEDTRVHYLNFLHYLMYFFPNIVETLSLFYNTNILSKLTRLQRINTDLKRINKQAVWEISKEEFQTLGNFGYRELVFEESQTQEIDIETILKQERDLEQTQDEEYLELETLDKQEIILNYYQPLLSKINDSIQLFAKSFSENLMEMHQSQLHLFNTVLHESYLDAKYGNYFTQKAFETVFNIHIIAQNKELAGLATIYCHVIQKDEQGQTIRRIEAFIDKIKLDIYQLFDLKLFEIFQSIFEYLVEFKFDTEYKQKVFDMLFKSIDKFPQKKKTLLLYLSDHINELYFNSCFTFLEQILKEQVFIDPQTINDAFQNFLEYEEFAIKLYLEKIDTCLQQEVVQEVKPYQKLKLQIMTEYENQDIQNLANNLIEKHSFLNFTVNDLNEIDFGLVIFEIPKDMHSIVNKVFQKIFDNLTDNDQKRTFINTILEAFHKILTESKEETKNQESQERLELFPNIIKSLLAYIEDDFVKRIYECLILTERQNFTILTQTTLNLGITILHHKKNLLNDLVKYFQLVLQKEKGLMSPLIFIGESTKLDSTLSEQFKNLDQDILKLLSHKNLDFHINLAQFLRVLISFFNEPKKLVLKLIEETKNLEDQEQINIQCNFISGLLKGLGIEYVEKYNVIQDIHDMLNKSTKKDMREVTIGKRLYAVFMIKAMWNVFKKLLEPKMSQIISILVQFLGDFDFQVREQSKSILDMLMKSMSNYSIKLCIPILLKGTEDKNWRTKLNSIQGLAAVSYCGIKQLSENLPVIVPKLTLKINDTNEEIRDAALKSLSLILSTIKNPEISEIRDIIIKSLSDPYLYNHLSLDALLNIRFRHYIDGPSLSLIIPILTYGLKSMKKSEYKQKAAKIVANIFSLIQNDSDIWPHIENLIDSLKHALRDVDNEVRALASKAFKSIGVRFPNLSNFMLNKLKETLVDENTISIAKSGHAQAFAEVLSTQNQSTIENIFQNMIELTKDRRDYVRESFLSVFVYLPIVFGPRYSKYVKQTTDIVIESISCEIEILRNLAIKAIKMLIHNFFEEYQDYFIEIVYQNSIEEDPIVRKSAQILNGDIVEILMNTIQDREQIYLQYPRVFALLYIMKNDVSADVRFVSNNIFKNFIDNTPKCIKKIFGSLMEIFMELYGQNDDNATEIANQGYKEFVIKYGNNYLTNILNYMIQIKKSGDLEKIRSVSVLMKYFVEYFNKGSLNKTRIQNMSEFLNELFINDDEVVWQNAISGMVNLTESTNSVSFLRKIIKKLIKVIENEDKLQQIIEEEDEDEENSVDQNEEQQEEGQDIDENDQDTVPEDQEIDQKLVEKDIQQENQKNSDKEEEKEVQGSKKDKSEEDQENEVDENSETPQIQDQSKLIQLLCQLLESDVIKIVNFANDFVFLNPFKEWQVQIMIIHARVYGSLMYQHKDMQDGIKTLLEYYEEHPDLEFQEIFLYLCTELCKNLDQNHSSQFLDNIQVKMTLYSKNKNFRMLFFILEMLRGFLEGADMELTKKNLKIAWLTSNLLNYNENGRQFLLDKTIEIIKVSTNIVTQERSGELITDIVYNIKKQIENTKEGVKQPWLEEEKLIGIYLNLIAKVLRSQETHVSVQGIDALIYFLEILDDKIIENYKENIYGYILRALSYQHTDNLLKKVFLFFNEMLDKKHYPDETQKYLFMYLIHSHNDFQSGVLFLEDLMQFTHRMIEVTETEFSFLKKWKRKILNDGLYKIEKLYRFISWNKSKSIIYKEFVDNITE